VDHRPWHQELNEAISLEVREYQTVLAQALELLDSARLEWDERLYGGRRKPLVGYARDGVPFAETYDPSADINGDYAPTGCTGSWPAGTRTARSSAGSN